MAQVARLRPSTRKQLEKEMEDGFRERNLKSKVSLVASKLAGRYQLFVISPDFRALSESERQDIIWQVLKERWSREYQLRLTLCIGMTPREAAGVI